MARRSPFRFEPDSIRISGPLPERRVLAAAAADVRLPASQAVGHLGSPPRSLTIQWRKETHLWVTPVTVGNSPGIP